MNSIWFYRTNSTDWLYSSSPLHHNGMKNIMLVQLETRNVIADETQMQTIRNWKKTTYTKQHFLCLQLKHV